jgi:hypothetical protein
MLGYFGCVIAMYSNLNDLILGYPVSGLESDAQLQMLMMADR